MSIVLVDERGENIPFPAPAPEPKPRKNAAPREAPPDKPLDGPTTKTEVQRALAVTYNCVHRILHDDVRYTANEFAEEADGIMELLQQHSQLRVVMRIVAPIAAIGAMYEKIESTVARFRERRQALTAKKAKVAEQKSVSPNAPVEVQSNVAPASVIANGAGKGIDGSSVRGRALG